MIEIRPGGERGRTALDWLDSRHTFSFADYHDPRHEGFRALRVINEDRLAPGRGFEPHFHRDMEILSWVLEGALEHKDSTGAGSTIHAGELQRMSAGRGVTHSEFNASKTDPVHFLQIWLAPRTRGAHASYEQRAFDACESHGLLCIASGGGREGAVKVDQDLDLFLVHLEPGDRVHHALAPGRYAWVQAVRGTIRSKHLRLEAGDGAAYSEEAAVEIAAETAAEALVFDLA